MLVCYKVGLIILPLALGAASKISIELSMLLGGLSMAIAFPLTLLAARLGGKAARQTETNKSKKRGIRRGGITGMVIPPLVFFISCFLLLDDLASYPYILLIKYLNSLSGKRRFISFTTL